MKRDISVEQSCFILRESIHQMNDIKLALEKLHWKLGPQQLEHLRIGSGKIQEAMIMQSNCSWKR